MIFHHGMGSVFRNDTFFINRSGFLSTILEEIMANKKAKKVIKKAKKTIKKAKKTIKKAKKK